MAKSYEELKRQAAVIKNETEVGANTANRVGTMFEDGIDFSNSILAIANTASENAASAQQTANAAQQSADVTAANCGFVVAIGYNGGTLYDKIPKELRKPGLIVEYKSSSLDDKINFKAQRFIGKDVSDEFWLNDSYWEEVFKEPTPYILTSSKIYDALPKGSILQSAYGNIFGNKWAPMDGVVAWDVSNMEEIDGTAIKGASRALYAKGYYYCSVFGVGIVYSSDLITWSPVDIKGDTSPYYLLNFYYDKSSDLLVASFIDAVEEDPGTVRIYISKDGLTWNEYSLGNDLIAVNIVSGKNSMMATVGDISSGEISFYVAEGVDLETASWKLIPEQRFTPLSYTFSHIYYDETRSKFIIITGDGIYEKNDDTTSLLELKAPIPEYIAMPELSANDKDNTYILRSQWDIHRFTYIAKNKDTTTWEEFKVQVSTDGEMLSSFVFSIKDIYYVLLPATFVGGALDSITLMGYPVFEYAVTDGENFIGFNFTEGKIYRTKLAQALEPVQYGYIKIE